MISESGFTPEIEIEIVKKKKRNRRIQLLPGIHTGMRNGFGAKGRNKRVKCQRDYIYMYIYITTTYERANVSY